MKKEECVNGLQFLKEHAMELVDDEDMEGNMVYDYYNLTEEDEREYVEPLEKLIQEHFDNPPLKFEELEEGMWVWDNAIKSWFQIRCIDDKLTFTVQLYLINGFVINVKFKENRFYRKQVEE